MQTILVGQQKFKGVSGVRGVTWHNKTGKWHARHGGGRRGKRISLGYFASVEEAAHALEKARGKIEPQGETIVSDEDFEFLAQFVWHFTKAGYVCRNIKMNGKATGAYMHRDIAERMGLSIEGRQIDHINRNARDNRRENIRLATSSQNNANREKDVRNHSGVRGVFWDTARSKWVATVRANNREVFRKRFLTFEEAVLARKHAAKLYQGDFASD